MTDHRPHREAYTQVADEFGVHEFIVRDLCGPVGRQTDIKFEDRVAMLRMKMDTAGFIPAVQHRGPSKDIPEEPRELRNCVLCEEFLADDDPGEEVVDSEGELEPGVVCRNCNASTMRP